ncbi:MAG: gamma carbonic anhydrase family protein [Planctomycetota bacterium]|jgi:UDP-N-acetylglucosamine acyltransferase
MAAAGTNLSIHQTASVHPSAVLEGKVTVGPYTAIGAGVVITGEVTIGHHSLVQCNTVIRGRNSIGNYVHIYDCVCIEQGRPAGEGSSTAEVPDRSVIEDYGWINHGATMHGAQVGEGAVVGLNASLDYNTRVGAGAIVADGSACPVDFEVPANCLAEGVPARIVQRDITDEDRRRIMGLVPRQWAEHAARWQEQAGQA